MEETWLQEQHSFTETSLFATARDSTVDWRQAVSCFPSQQSASQGRQTLRQVRLEGAGGLAAILAGKKRRCARLGTGCYLGYWRLAKNEAMMLGVEFQIKVAGSMVLSSLASLLAVVAFLLAYVLRNDWAIVLWWAVLPELLVFTLVYLVADFVHSTTRRQAALSLLIVLPALITQVWFFQNLHV